MKTGLAAALAVSFFAIGGPAAAQAGRQITPEDIAAAATLFGQIRSSCSADSKSKACGILAYSPEDCTARKIDAHIRQVYNTYEDGTVRFQQGNDGVTRRPPIALLAPLGVIGRDGKTTSYASPQFVSWEDYQGGRKSVAICGKTERLAVKDFTMSGTLEKFLKANP